MSPSEKAPSGFAATPVNANGQLIHHVAYVVDDLRSAITFWVTTFGAGPFFILEHIEYDAFEVPGESAPVFDHSFAFGQCGSLSVELQQLHQVKPASLATRMQDRTFSHVAFICDDPKVESERLEKLGLPLFMYARVDAADVEVRFHDVPQLTHSLELHRRSDALIASHDAVASAARGWDGSEPVRSWPPVAT